MNRLTLAALLLCLSGAANTQIPNSLRAFIKADDPNTLEYYYADNTDCPWTEQEAQSVIEGVIKRSRINTAHGLGGPNNFYLSVVSSCLATGSSSMDTGYSVYHEIMFGDFPFLHQKRYGNILSGAMNNNQFYLNALKMYVENAITDFVEVNFLSNPN